MIKAVGYLLIACEVKADECPCRQDKIHRVNTGNTVF